MPTRFAGAVVTPWPDSGADSDMPRATRPVGNQTRRGWWNLHSTASMDAHAPNKTRPERAARKLGVNTEG
jgi:hypothetical protein